MISGHAQTNDNRTPQQSCSSTRMTAAEDSTRSHHSTEPSRLSALSSSARFQLCCSASSPCVLGFSLATGQRRAADLGGGGGGPGDLALVGGGGSGAGRLGVLGPRLLQDWLCRGEGEPQGDPVALRQEGPVQELACKCGKVSEFEFQNLIISIL